MSMVSHGQVGQCQWTVMNWEDTVNEMDRPEVSKDVQIR